MIYVLLFWEFLQIGLFAIGGGLVTVPFLFDLAQKYEWFSNGQLTDIIAVAQSVPGAVGINMAAYAGYYAAGVSGGILAPLAEVLPSMIIVYIIASILNKLQENQYVKNILHGVQPAVLTLILYAAWQICKEITLDYQNIIIFALILPAMHFYKKNVIFYIIISAIIGIIFEM